MQGELNEPLRINTIPLWLLTTTLRFSDELFSPFFFHTEFFQLSLFEFSQNSPTVIFGFSQTAAHTHIPSGSSGCHFPGLLAVWAPQPIRAQECPALFQAHRDLYIYEPPFEVPLHVFCSIFFLLLLLLHCSFQCLGPRPLLREFRTLVGARYVWDHLYRTPHSNTHASIVCGV